MWDDHDVNGGQVVLPARPDHGCLRSGVGLASRVTDPIPVAGRAWENGCIESFNGKLRETNSLTGRSSIDCRKPRPRSSARQQSNERRPHRSLGNRPPAPKGYRAPFMGSPLAAAATFGVTLTLAQQLVAARSQRSSRFALFTVEPLSSGLVLDGPPTGLAGRR